MAIAGRPVAQFAVVGFSLLPFGLQLLGWVRTPLGGGWCGALSGGYLDVFSAQVWYSQLLIGGLALQVAYAFLWLVLLNIPGARGQPELPGGSASQLEPLERSLYTAGIGLNSILLMLFLLTRLTGLPLPSSLGVLWGEPAPLDPLSVLMALSSVALVILLIGLRRRGSGSLKA